MSWSFETDLKIEMEKSRSFGKFGKEKNMSFEKVWMAGKGAKRSSEKDLRIGVEKSMSFQMVGKEKKRSFVMAKRMSFGKGLKVGMEMSRSSKDLQTQWAVRKIHFE